MNDCHLSIRSIVLPIHPLDSEAPDEGFSPLAKLLVRIDTPHPARRYRGEPPSPARGEGALSSRLQTRQSHFFTIAQAGSGGPNALSPEMVVRIL
jgi:hypothetical protein